MHRITVVLACLLVASSAHAQSKVERFTTTYDSAAEAYTHHTAYEFYLPDTYGSDEYQVATEPEIIADIYWNTRRVWIYEGGVACRNAQDTEWIVWSVFAAKNYMTQHRTWIPPERRCIFGLGFSNSPDERYVNSAQKGAVRINVSVTSGGFMRLQKIPISDLRDLDPPGRVKLFQRIE